MVCDHLKGISKFKIIMLNVDNTDLANMWGINE